MGGLTIVLENLTISIQVAIEDAVEHIEHLQNKIWNFTSNKDALCANIRLTTQNAAETMRALEDLLDKKDQLLTPIKIVIDADADQYVTKASDAVNTVNELYARNVENFKASLKQKMDDFKAYKAQQLALINQGYQQEIASIEKLRDQEIAAYEQKIYELNETLRQNTIKDKDAADLKKIKALEDQLRYEKDEGNIYYIQKALDDAKAAYETRKNTELIQEQIQSHKNSIQMIKEAAKSDISAAKEIRDARIEALNAVEAEHNETMQAIKNEMDVYTKKVQSTMDQTEKSVRVLSGEAIEIADHTQKNVTQLVKSGQENNIQTILSFWTDYFYAGKHLGEVFSLGFSESLRYIEEEIERLRDRLYDFSRETSALSSQMQVQQAAMISNTNSLGGITQNFYQKETTPYEAKKMALDIMASVF